jgi:GAF domain
VITDAAYPGRASRTCRTGSGRSALNLMRATGISRGWRWALKLRGSFGRIALVAAFAGGIAAGVANGYLRFQSLAAQASAGGAYHDALAALHLPAALYVAYFLGTEALCAATFAAGAAVIAWRGTGPLKTFAAIVLVLYGVTIPPAMHALVVEVPGLFSDDALHTLLAFERSAGIALFVIFFYVFPDGRFPTATARVFAAAVAAWALLWPWPWFHAINPYRFPEPWPFVALTLLFASGVALQLDHYNRLTAIQRQQAKWVVYGVVASVAGDFVTHVPWTFHLVREQQGDVIALVVHQPFFIASQMAVPVTVAFSLLQRNLWKVDRVVARSVLYAVASACITAVWASVNAVVDRISKESISGAASATLISGLVLKPLYSALEALLDKHMKPESFEPESEFPELTPALRGSVPLPRMMRVIVEHTARLVHAENAALYLVQDAEPCYPAAQYAMTSADAAAQIPRIDALRSRLADGKPVRRGEDDDGSAPLAVPLTLPRGEAHDLIGVLALGRCTGERGYTAEDLSSLEALGALAGTAIYFGRIKSGG